MITPLNDDPGPAGPGAHRPLALARDPADPTQARHPDRDWIEVPFQAQKPQAGLRVDRFLTQRLHRYSRAQVQRLIKDGRVLLRGAAVKASGRLADGDVVVIRYPRRDESDPLVTRLDVLYEDERMLAVHKPAGVLSHPTDKVLRNCVTSILAAQFPGRRLHLAHRLDRETSGVVILAKDPEAARALTDAFTRREVRKQYLAIVAGRVAFARKTVSLPVAEEGLKIKARRKVAEDGAPAATDFVRLGASDSASLLRASPKTGRMHQIRVHLAALGHPVLGDKLYTGAGEAYLKICRREWSAEDAAALGAGRQMLHAHRAELTSPAGRRVAVVAPPPADFIDCLGRRGLSLP